MKKRKDLPNRVAIGIIITLIIFFTLNFGIEADTTQSINCQCNDYQMRKTTNPLGEKNFFSDLTPHGPIEILSDDDFTNYGFPGLGSERHPYVIEGFNINTEEDYGIYVWRTTTCFIIQNCYINAKKGGIFIEQIEGKCEIINNTCVNNENSGIRIEIPFTSSSILNNTCNFNDFYGIITHASFYFPCLVSNNTCNYNNYSGIRIDNCHSSTVSNNTCNNNLGNGIVSVSSNSCNITDNICANNREGGIWFGNSDDCRITNNYLEANDDFGVYLNSVAVNNRIYSNSFVDNEKSSQAYDDGKNNKWHDSESKEGNHWSDLGSECVYKIDGKANSRDKYPLNRAENCPNPNTMTTLTIVLPVVLSAILLAFLVPIYIIPYIRNHFLPFIRKKREPSRSIWIVLSVIGVGGFIVSLSFVISFLVIGEFAILFIPIPLLTGFISTFIAYISLLKLIRLIKKEKIRE